MAELSGSDLPEDWEDQIQRAYATFGYTPEITEFEGWNPKKQWRAPKGGEGAGRYVEMPDIKAVIKSAQKAVGRLPGRKAKAENIQRQKEYREKLRAHQRGEGRKPRQPKEVLPKEPGAPKSSASEGTEAAPKELKPIRPFTPEGQAKFDAVPTGWRKATHEELRKASPGETYSGMHINLDPDAANPIHLFKPDGKDPKRLYTFAHHLTQERKKWGRVERLLPQRKQLTDDLREGTRQGDDVATALHLIMETGMRPSSDAAMSYLKGDDGKDMVDAKGEKKKVKTYGASNLLAKHVVRQNKDGSVTLDFIGKSGVRNQINVSDPDLVKELMRRKGNLGPNDQLFPEATETKMRDMMKVKAGDEFHVKDLRTMWANVYTAQYMEAIIKKKGRTPKDQDEWVEWMEDATKLASKRLGNEHATFKENYLSAIPFMDLMPGTGDDWEDYWEWGKKMKDPKKLFSVLTEFAARAGDRVRGTTLARMTDEELEEIYRETNDKMPSMDELVKKWIESKGITDLGPEDIADEGEPWDDTDDPLFPNADEPVKEAIKEEIKEEVRERRIPKRPPL